MKMQFLLIYSKELTDEISAFVMNQHMPMTPPEAKTEKLESDYIPTLSEVSSGGINSHKLINSV